MSRNDRPVCRKNTSSNVGSERLIDFSRDLLPIEQSEKLGQRGAAVLYVETQPAVLDANLPDERLGSQERAGPFDEPVVDQGRASPNRRRPRA